MNERLSVCDPSEVMRAIARASQDMLWATNEVGELVYANEAWQVFFGSYSRDSGLGRFDASVHPDERDQLRYRWSEGAAFAMDLRLGKEGGPYRWFTCRFAPLSVDETGDAGWAGHAIDIQERKRAEQRSEVVLANIGDHIASYDREWRFTYANEGAAKVLGKRVSELVGNCIWELFPEAIGNQYDRELREAAETGRIIRSRHHYTPWDSWYENCIYPHDEGVTVFSIDVTQQVRAELELERLQGRLNAFMDHLPAYAWSVDDDDRIVYVNSRWADEDGGRDRFLGRPFADHLPPTMLAEYRRRNEEVRRTGRSSVSVEYASPADGSEGVFVVHRFPLPNPSGGLAVGGLALDVTELAQTQEALRASEERFRCILEQAPLSVQTFGPGGESRSANPAWSRLWDADPKALADYNILKDPQLVRKGVMPVIQAAFAGTPQEIPPMKYDPADIGKPGRPRWVDAHIYPVKRESGEIFEVVLLLQDVTDRLEAEERLRQSQLRYESLVMATSQIVWTAAPDGQVVEDLPTWRDFTGQSFEESRGFGWLQRVHPDDVDGVKEVWQRSLDSGESYRYEMRVRNAKGHYRLLESRVVPVKDPAGEIIEWVGTCTDVTHERATQDELARLTLELEKRVHDRTRELEQANREMEGFTYMVSHDLRAALRGIVTTARLVVQEHGDALPLDAIALLRRQQASALKLAMLVDDLLTFSRVARQELRRADVDLSALVSEMAGEVAKSYERCRFVVEPALRAYGDPILLRLVVQNLLENAAKYSPKGGLITFGRNPDGAYYVRDEGIGFEMEYEPKLWIPFERLVRDEEFPGTGIGLANVRRVVERHGGRVWAESEPGKGSTFFFTLDAPRNQGSAR